MNDTSDPNDTNVPSDAGDGGDAAARAAFDVSSMETGIDAPRPDPEANRQRLVADSGVDARVASLIEPIAEDMGFHLVRVRMTGANGGTLQIMAERHDGSMSVEDCEALSRAISPVLDVEDPIPQAYHLEMSSPGIDRPLVRRSDFARWAGHLMKLETRDPVEGKRRFRGHVVSAGEGGFVIELDGSASGERVAIPFGQVADARLILTDELIRDSLKADKAARKDEMKTPLGSDAGAANDNSDEDGSGEKA